LNNNKKIVFSYINVIVFYLSVIFEKRLRSNKKKEETGIVTYFYLATRQPSSSPYSRKDDLSPCKEDAMLG
jgi:hypothetical protein